MFRLNRKKLFRVTTVFACLCASFASASALSHNWLFGNGAVDGNGSPIMEREPLDGAPHEAVVLSFLDQLAIVEPTFARIMLDFKRSDEPKDRVWFWKTDVTCYLRGDPNKEPLRAAFEFNSNFILLCPPFFAQDNLRQVSTVLHELTHYFLKRVPSRSASEEWVQGMESFYRQLLTAKDTTAYLRAAYNVRALLDRDVPALIGEVRPAEVVSDVRHFSITKDDGVRYLVPAKFFQNDFIAKHHFEHALRIMWLTNPSLGAAKLKTLARKRVSGEKVAGVRYACMRELDGQKFIDTCKSTEQNERVLSRDQVTPSFLQFLARQRQLTSVGDFAGTSWIQDDEFLYFVE